MSADLTRAANMAYRCLLRLQAGELPVDPLMMLRRCKNTVLYTDRQLRERVDLPEETWREQWAESDAFTLREDGANGATHYIVCYQPLGNQGRLRFTLAHELGHIVLKHHGTGDFEEREANCFASHLLCPRPVLDSLLAQTPTPSVDVLAKTFFLTPHAMEVTLSQRPVQADRTLATQVMALFAKQSEALIHPPKKKEEATD